VTVLRVPGGPTLISFVHTDQKDLFAYSGRFSGSMCNWRPYIAIQRQHQDQAVYSGRFGGSIYSLRLPTQTAYSGRFSGSIRCFALHLATTPRADTWLSTSPPTLYLLPHYSTSLSRKTTILWPLLPLNPSTTLPLLRQTSNLLLKPRTSSSNLEPPPSSSSNLDPHTERASTWLLKELTPNCQNTHTRARP
jgi:hypothetical protein